MTTILLQIASEARRCELAELLTNEKFEVISESGELMNQSADVILSDGSRNATLARAREPGGVAGQVALAAVDWVGPADVVLPDDATQREMTLVCTLLAEITRLRRENDHRRRERSEMRHLAFSDPLTELPNRRAWDDEAHQHFDRAVAAGQPLSLAIVDLDHFKNVNGSYGFAIGDKVLKDAARAISASVRASDFLARLGGDEFGLLLPASDPSAVATIMERIRRAIANHCSGPMGPNISASVGFAMLQHDEKFSKLFDRADAALRRAKEMGRDRAVSAS